MLAAADHDLVRLILDRVLDHRAQLRIGPDRGLEGDPRVVATPLVGKPAALLEAVHDRTPLFRRCREDARRSTRDLLREPAGFEEARLRRSHHPQHDERDRQGREQRCDHRDDDPPCEAVGQAADEGDHAPSPCSVVTSGVKR
jgi:hypothetical protein